MAMQRFPVNEFGLPPWATPGNPNPVAPAAASATGVGGGSPRGSSAPSPLAGIVTTTPRAGGTPNAYTVPQSAFESQADSDLYNGIGMINLLFGNRAPIYGQVRDDLYSAQADRLNQNREDTLRQLRFGLARTGLAGGSADIGAHGMEQRTYGRSLMDASQQAQSLADEVRANDEKTRLNLIAQMRAGLDQANATSSALSQMTNNVNAARGANAYQAVDAYAQAMQPALANYQIQQGMQQARRNYVPYRIAPGSSGTLISQ